MGALWSFGLFVLATGSLWLTLHDRRKKEPSLKPNIRLTTLLSPLSPFNGFLPRLPFISLGSNWSWKLNHQIFQQVGCDIISITSLLPTPTTILLVADGDVAKEITKQRVKYPKPEAFFRVFSIFGNSIINTEGNEWQHHRRIVSPAFNERTNALVWHATSEIMLAVFRKWDESSTDKIVSIKRFEETAMQITLLVFCRAGFGQPADWESRSHIPSGHSKSFQEVLEIFTNNVPLYMLFPHWILNRFHRGRGVVSAFTELRRYMLEMAEDQRASQIKKPTNDLLSNIVDATYGDSSFSESDLTGSLFMLTLAGHESSAHTLAFAMALLAVHPEEQMKLWDEVSSTLGDQQSFQYSDILKLKYCLAVVHEASRLYSIASFVPKVASEPCVLRTKNHKGDPIDVPVARGTIILLSIDALHANPRYWPDPYAFKPSRFLDESVYSTGAFMPFSSGLRGCIGRRFAEIELVTAVALLVLRYQITVMQEPQFSTETPEETKARVLSVRMGLTIRPSRVPLTFTPRS